MSADKGCKTSSDEEAAPTPAVARSSLEMGESQDSIDIPVITENPGVDDNENEATLELESFRLKWQAELQAVSKSSTNDSDKPSASRASRPSLGKGKSCTEQSKHFNPMKKKLSRVLEEEPSNANSTKSALNEQNANAEKASFGKNTVRFPAMMSEEDKELTARALYTKGWELEKAGKLYEAIQQYKKAMQLVPDIENRMSQHFVAEVSEDDTDSDSAEDNTQDSSDRGLWYSLNNLLDPTAPICEALLPVYGGTTHISSLPREIFEHILLWLVGQDLDMRSLNSLSAVCRGMYVLTKSETLWRKACQRVWGTECSLRIFRSTNEDSDGVVECYPTWREMFLLRPQPRYNGCYISKTSYFRSGECNFHDSSYQPWHLVSYYRFFRFFPGGDVLMLTTSDLPQNAVGHLVSRASKNNQVLAGTYTLDGSLVTLEFHRQHDVKKPTANNNNRRIRRRQQQQYQGGSTDVESTTMHITVELLPTRKDVRSWFLWWKKYTITNYLVNGLVRNSPIDVSQLDTFPQLAFSRVKSYTRECSEALA